MRKALQGIFLTSLMAIGLNTVRSEKAQAQVIQDKYWGQWDIPYVEQRGWSLGWNIGIADMWVCLQNIHISQVSGLE
jgi:glycyl-tRNA synthetase alpha subunit